ncbi:MAG: hypothetical protein MZV70_67255 [Desulfobacterales bacterium]|nr:hypothetical protein [Desulfobacterales bacterium]
MFDEKGRCRESGRRAGERHDQPDGPGRAVQAGRLVGGRRMDEFGSRAWGASAPRPASSRLVDELPRDQQLILLKQLLGDRITQHLYKLVLEMSDDEQPAADASSWSELPFERGGRSRPSTLDEDGRLHASDPAHVLPAAARSASLDADTFDGIITDISTGRHVHQDRPSPYPAGKPIRVSCRLARPRKGR